MNKYFILFCINAAVMKEWMSQPDTEARDAQNKEAMEAWQKWLAEHEGMILDKGLPLGKTKRVTANGIEDITNDLNYYVTIEAESHDAAAEMFKGHPHLNIPSAYIEVISASRPAA